MEIFIFCAVRCIDNKMKRPVVYHNVARGTNCTTCLENFFFLDSLQNQFPWVDVALLTTEVFSAKLKEVNVAFV